MNVAKLRGKVVLWLLCAAAACGVWEQAHAAHAAQRRGTRSTPAATRRARRAAAVRRARARNVKRPAAKKKTTTPRSNVPVIRGTPDDGSPSGPVGPAVVTHNDGPPPGRPPAKKWVVVEGGVLNGKALSMPAPEYPPLARAARAQGNVTVRIIVDEDGRVISANAVRGHSLLRQSAVETVLQWRFPPTLLSGQPVRVTGLVTVNYTLR